MRFSFVLLLAIAALVALASLRPSPSAASTLGAIRGAVYDEGGHPISQAGVDAVSPTSPKQHTTTDTDGRYVFPRLEFDTYTVTVTASGFGAQKGVATVTSGGAATLDFHLGKKTLATVTTVAKSGHPVSVAVVSPTFVQTLPDNRKLASVTFTMPGIVPFSYDEPVARGFHGISYFIDGIPIPQTTSSSFGEVLNPADIGSLEIYTGSFPAEFGGSRMGGLVNILTRRPQTNGGYFVVTGGNYASGQTQLSDQFGGQQLRGYVSLNLFRTSPASTRQRRIR